jgi:hypothetical protein
MCSITEFVGIAVKMAAAGQTSQWTHIPSRTTGIAQEPGGGTRMTCGSVFCRCFRKRRVAMVERMKLEADEQARDERFKTLTTVVVDKEVGVWSNTKFFDADRRERFIEYGTNSSNANSSQYNDTVVNSNPATNSKGRHTTSAWHLWSKRR